MKKAITLLLVLMLGLTLLAGCGGSKDNKGNVDTPNADSKNQSVETGGLNGKYYELNEYSNETGDDYLEFRSDGTCTLYLSSIEIGLDGKFSVSGNAITFAEGAEFAVGNHATIVGDKVIWDKGDETFENLVTYVKE
ncbi:MAG: hypothetical protein LBH28_00795 [Oscillospiraceae bacterium]|jgi:predicted small lipoprotein YifL|nr:hypothetical protein [Oscillospiraceae bacterium]